jgi:hypothetical protein
VNIPPTVVATSGAYRLTAHERIEGGWYGLIEAERIDGQAIDETEQAECHALLDLFESELGGNC